jgi:hypothetical protein
MPLHAVQANQHPLSPLQWYPELREQHTYKNVRTTVRISCIEQLLTLSVYKGGKNTVNGEPEGMRQGRRDSSQRRQKEAGREQA